MLHVVDHFIHPILVGLDVGKLFDIRVDIKNRRISKIHPKTKRYTFNCTYLCGIENKNLYNETNS